MVKTYGFFSCTVFNGLEFCLATGAYVFFDASASAGAFFYCTKTKGESQMRIGIKKKIDKNGRLVIPKEYREFYHLDREVTIIDTPDGVLITNPNYKMVKTEKE